MYPALYDEHQQLAILTAKHVADRLQAQLGNNVANWVFDVLAQDLILSSKEELRVVMDEITGALLREEDIRE